VLSLGDSVSVRFGSTGNPPRLGRVMAGQEAATRDIYARLTRVSLDVTKSVLRNGATFAIAAIVAIVIAAIAQKSLADETDIHRDTELAAMHATSLPAPLIFIEDAPRYWTIPGSAERRVISGTVSRPAAEAVRDLAARFTVAKRLEEILGTYRLRLSRPASGGAIAAAHAARKTVRRRLMNDLKVAIRHRVGPAEALVGSLTVRPLRHPRRPAPQRARASRTRPRGSAVPWPTPPVVQRPCWRATRGTSAHCARS
jgi:hypothetical protein